MAQDKDALCPPALLVRGGAFGRVHIRSNLTIMGVSADGLQHKISLYVDDVLLYVSNPEKSLPLILDTIAQ